MNAGMLAARATALAWLIVVAPIVAPAHGADTPADPPSAASPAPEQPPRKSLRVAVMPLPLACEWTGSQPTGFMIDVWQDLAARLGVDTTFVRIQSVAGLMESVTVDTADVALGPLAITEERERVIDLTHPIFHSGMRIAVRQRRAGGLLGAIGSLVSWQLLALLGAVLVLAGVSGHLLWWCERGADNHSFPTEYPRGVFEAIWWITSTIITGGCDDKHVDTGLGRLLAFAWMVGGIVLVAAFTSVLTATMTAERVTGSIHSPRDLAGRVVGCQRQTVAVTSVRQRGGIVEEFDTGPDALNALEMGMVEAVVGESQSLMFLIAASPHKDLRLVGPMFESFDYGLAMANGSPIRERLNTAILRMREDGTLDRIKNAWLGSHE